jgi:hypothetical protein
MTKKELYFQSCMLQAEIRMNGMIAENKQREYKGEAMAYVYDDFEKLITEYAIYHNAFPFRDDDY